MSGSEWILGASDNGRKINVWSTNKLVNKFIGDFNNITDFITFSLFNRRKENSSMYHWNALNFAQFP